MGIPTGAIRYNTDSNKMECFDGTQWWVISVSYPSASISGRGLMFSGYTSPTSINTIDYITIQVKSNSIDFGDLSHISHAGVAVGSRTRALYAGGQTTPPGTAINTIEFVQIQSQGNSSDFGDNTTVLTLPVGGVSNGTRGIWGGGNTPGKSDVINYVTISQMGNAADFGDLTDSRADGGAVCSPIRGVFGGGYDPSMKDVMDYITMATLGNAVDFGNLSGGSRVAQSPCNATRGLFCGQYTPTAYNVIDYITIATTGNSQDFGDCSTIQGLGGSGGSMSDATRGVMPNCYAGGGGETNIISYVTFATKGNAQEFGDRAQTGYQGPGKTSNAHGGL